MKIQTLKTANLTCTIVGGKLTQARNSKGRFVKLSIAQNELNALIAKKEDLYNYVAIVTFILFIHILFCVAISGGYAFLITIISTIIVMIAAVSFDLFKIRFSPVLNALKLI